MGKGQPVELVLDGGDDARIAMTQTGDRRAAGRVEILLALGVPQIGSRTALGDRDLAFQAAVKHAAGIGLWRHGNDAFILRADRKGPAETLI